MDNTLLSLYDYLGKAAGKKLGEEVNKAAQSKKIPINTRQVSNPKYEGIVLLYPKWFLDEYFGNSPRLFSTAKQTVDSKKEDTTNSQEEDDDELPF